MRPQTFHIECILNNECRIINAKTNSTSLSVGRVLAYVPTRRHVMRQKARGCDGLVRGRRNEVCRASVPLLSNSMAHTDMWCSDCSASKCEF